MKRWTREEVIIAYALYCTLPYKQFKESNPLLQRVARHVGHSPASLRMLLCNLVYLDPDMRVQGITGLKSVSKLATSVYTEFCNDWIGLSNLAEEYLGFEIFSDIPDNKNRNHRKHFSEVSQKNARSFFSKAVKAAYNNRCCISGMEAPEFLIASHIKPWHVSDDKTEKANPANGLCLNVFYDRAFDQGFITVDRDYKVRISSKMRQRYTNHIYYDWLYSIDRKSIKVPNRFRPDKRLLEYHNDVIFIG